MGQTLLFLEWTQPSTMQYVGNRYQERGINQETGNITLVFYYISYSISPRMTKHFQD